MKKVLLMNKHNKTQVHTVENELWHINPWKSIAELMEYFFSSDYKVYINPAVSKYGRYG